MECCQSSIYSEDRHTGVFVLCGITGLGSDLRAGLGNGFDTVGSVSTYENKEAITQSDKETNSGQRNENPLCSSPTRFSGMLGFTGLGGLSGTGGFAATGGFSSSAEEGFVFLVCLRRGSRFD